MKRIFTDILTVNSKLSILEMECFIVSESDIDLGSKSLTLRGDEARHAVRVLRISEGEQLLATTLNGFATGQLV